MEIFLNDPILLFIRQEPFERVMQLTGTQLNVKFAVYFMCVTFSSGTQSSGNCRMYTVKWHQFDFDLFLTKNFFCANDAEWSKSPNRFFQNFVLLFCLMKIDRKSVIKVPSGSPTTPRTPIIEIMFFS